jgi:hypothetical protein
VEQDQKGIGRHKKGNVCPEKKNLLGKKQKMK